MQGCLTLIAAILMQKFPGSVKLICPENQCHIMRRIDCTVLGVQIVKVLSLASVLCSLQESRHNRGTTDGSVAPWRMVERTPPSLP